MDGDSISEDHAGHRCDMISNFEHINHIDTRVIICYYYYQSYYHIHFNFEKPFKSYIIENVGFYEIHG